jgi:RNA polymerase sigma-70 factor, ECF subfamily
MSVAVPSPEGTTRTAAVALADLDESTLVERAKSGDSDAVGELYRRHHSAVCGCVQALMRTQLNDVEDVAAEVWVSALKALPRFRNDGSATFKSWLYGIARYRVLDWFRHPVRQEELEAEVDPGIDLGRTGKPEAIVVDRVEVQDLLANLPARQRQVLLLRFGCDLTIPEVSRIMRAAELQTMYVERTSEMMVGRLTKQALAAVDEQVLAREIRRRARRFMADPDATWQPLAPAAGREAA